jgi:predicted adenine nucleotide alpha hydrolase (AANH) superfamily ATPase
MTRSRHSRLYYEVRWYGAMDKIRVLDCQGRELSPCSPGKAQRLLAQGRATLAGEDPLTIQLPYAVDSPPKPEEAEVETVGEGRSILLHICCGPCSTYTINRLRVEGFQVVGYWYNPNIHPFTEHEERRASFEKYAQSVGLPFGREDGYEMPQFLRLVAGSEAHGKRCRLCYEMRLTRTASVAAREGFDAFTTTLLISPHQNQGLLWETGEKVAKEYEVEFYFENFRCGWSERGHLTDEHGLYRQQYCGCIYSEWERYAGVKISTLLSEGGGD